MDFEILFEKPYISSANSNQNSYECTSFGESKAKIEGVEEKRRRIPVRHNAKGIEPILPTGTGWPNINARRNEGNTDQFLEIVT